jgi:hypothetical protein
MLAAIGTLALAYGVWLLTTIEGTDGGRQFVGTVATAGGACVLLLAVLVTRVRIPTRASRPRA